MKPPGVLAVLALIAGGACGHEEPPPQSMVVVTVSIASGVSEVHQLKVRLHYPGHSPDPELLFPPRPSSAAILSGATFGIVLPLSLMGMLDLNVEGLDSIGATVAVGSTQAQIVVGGRVDVPLALGP
jgi:hypothetical protein